jgi:hypothetical protein
MPKNITTPNTTEPNTETSVTILNKCGASSNPLFKFIPNIPAAHVADVKHNDAMDRQRLASKNLFRAASILASIKSLYIYIYELLWGRKRNKRILDVYLCGVRKEIAVS